MADFKADGCILTGSLTEAAAGVPFIDAGTNITTEVNADGSITINASGGSSTADVGWTAPAADQIATTGSLSLSPGLPLYFNGQGGDQSIYSSNGNSLFLDADDYLYIYTDMSMFVYGGTILNTSAGANFDFRVKGSTGMEGAILFDAGTAQLGLLTDGSYAGNAYGLNASTEPIPGYVGLFISGAVGSANSTDPDLAGGSTLMGGDLVLSGALSLEVNEKIYFNGPAGDQWIRGNGATLIIDGDNYVYLDADTHVGFRVGGVATVGLTTTEFVINEYAHAGTHKDFRVETFTEANAFFIDPAAETITTSVPLLNKDKPRLSKYITAGTWTGTTSEVSIFSDAEWSVNPTYATSLTAAYITHNEDDGEFVVTYRCTYCVIVSIIAESTGTDDFTFRGYVAGVEKFEVADVFIHGSVDPVERTFSFLVDADASEALEFTIQPSSTGVKVKYATVSIYAI